MNKYFKKDDWSGHWPEGEKGFSFFFFNLTQCMDIFSKMVGRERRGRFLLHLQSVWVCVQGWTLAHARLPMAGNFHGGQVKFDKY